MGLFDKLRGKKETKAVCEQETTDYYVDSFFDFNFKEIPDNRDWQEISSLSEIRSKEMKDAFNGNKESCSKAIPLLEVELQNYPDYDVLYLWLGYCKKVLDGVDEARKIYLMGLEKSRLRAHLCSRLGMLAFEENNLSNAVKWWIRSCAIQATGGKYVDGTSFLNLAIIAKYLNLKKCHSKLWRQSLAIKDQTLTPSAELQRASMVQKQGTGSIAQAIEKLCVNYLVT